MKYLFTILIFVLGLAKAYSQSPVEEELGSWFTLSGNHKVADKISISTLVQAWDYEIADNFNFILFNVSGNYQLSPKITTSLAYGYADIDSGFRNVGPHTYENRISEQINYKHKLFKLPIDQRFRVEQRFLNKSTKNVLHNRLRYRIGTKVKLNKTLFIRIHNEYLATLQTKKIEGFAENRLYGALGFNLSSSVNIQTGYLYRRIKGLDLHRLQLGLFYKMDLRKKNKN